MRKTSKADYNRFVKAFKRCVKFFGRVDYTYYFHHEKLAERTYARIHPNHMAHCAHVYYNTELDDEVWSTRDKPEYDARHEAIHMLTSRLGDLARARFLDDIEITEEEERLVRSLEYVLDNWTEFEKSKK